MSDVQRSVAVGASIGLMVAFLGVAAAGYAEVWTAVLLSGLAFCG